MQWWKLWILDPSEQSSLLEDVGEEGDEMGEKSDCWVSFLTAVTENLPPHVIRGMGCATKSACDLKNITVGKNLQINTVCSNGSPPPRSVSSVLAALFLVKALL